jgi:putative hydrolase of the HAD superfamily
MTFGIRRVVVFDLDDTLYPERDYARSGLREAGRVALERFGIAGFGEVAVSLFDSGRRGDIFQQALRMLGLSDTSGSLVATMRDAYRSHRPTLRMFEDVEGAIPELQSSGPLALITDGYLPPQRLKVEALGIQEVFRTIVYTEQLGREHWKPSPAGFIAVERACQAAPKECVYIGDNPAKDFIAPRQRGWRTIRVRREGTEHGHVEASAAQAADVEVRDFWDVVGALTNRSR